MIRSPTDVVGMKFDVPDHRRGGWVDEDFNMARDILRRVSVFLTVLRKVGREDTVENIAATGLKNVGDVVVCRPSEVMTSKVSSACTDDGRDVSDLSNSVLFSLP